MNRTALVAISILCFGLSVAHAQTPQRTASTYRDWVVRCEVVNGPPLAKNCDLAQLFESKTQTPPAISQVLITRPNKKEPIRVVVQTQANVSISPGVRMMIDDKAQPLVVPFSRCFPGSCFASGALTDDMAKRLRARTEPVRLEFKDGAQRDVAVSVSINGFVAAYDAWVRE